MGLGSSGLSFEDRDPGIALQSEGDARGIFRVFEEGNHFLAELPRRQRRTEARQELLRLHARGTRVGAGACVANSRSRQ